MTFVQHDCDERSGEKRRVFAGTVSLSGDAPLSFIWLHLLQSLRGGEESRHNKTC